MQRYQQTEVGEDAASSSAYNVLQQQHLVAVAQANHKHDGAATDCSAEVLLQDYKFFSASAAADAAGADAAATSAGHAWMPSIRPHAATHR